MSSSITRLATCPTPHAGLVAARAAGLWSACAAAAGNPSAEGAESPCSRTFVSTCAAAAESEPFGGSVDSSAEVARSREPVQQDLCEYLRCCS